jgi:hypothetical protein
LARAQGEETAVTHRGAFGGPVGRAVRGAANPVCGAVDFVCAGVRAECAGVRMEYSGRRTLYFGCVKAIPGVTIWTAERQLVGVERRAVCAESRFRCVTIAAPHLARRLLHQTGTGVCGPRTSVYFAR